MGRIRRLHSLGPHDGLVLAQLLVLAHLSEAALRFVSVPQLLSWLTRGARLRTMNRWPIGHRRCDISRLAAFADSAARRTRGHDRCLIRSLLLFWLLQARGEAAVFRIGIRKDSGALLSHAWVEIEGRVLIDDALATTGYVPLISSAPA